MSLQMRCGTQKNRCWRLKNQTKSSSQGLKIHPKSSSKAIVLQRTLSNINFFENLWFFDDFWIPKYTQHQRKTPSNSMLKNNTFLDSIFEWIFFVLASENEGKIEQFSYFYRKRQFFKNNCFLERKLLFFQFGASKNLSKLDAQTQ